MTTIKHILLSLLMLCNITLAYGKATTYSDSPQTVTLETTAQLKPIDIIKNPNILTDKWLDEPISISQYTDEEKKLQSLINDKTATAVKTYSTATQDKEWVKYDHEAITPYTWKIIDVALTEANGKTNNVSLLRPNWWIRNIGADRLGNRFYLKIPEVAEGNAVVKAIRVNQLDTRLWDEQRNGDYVYRPITATFQHDSNNVLNLYFTNDEKPLGVTPEHRIYSMDKNDFVPAGSLSIGEKVKTYQGISTLVKKEKLEGTHKVYNIEVYRDHNYMVSINSIVVHNDKAKVGSGEGIFDPSDIQPYNTNLPLYGQANDASCVAGSCKMVLAPNLEVPESYIRQAIGTDYDGTHLSAVPQGLNDLGFEGSATYHNNFNVSGLNEAINKGETVIATIKPKAGGSHAVVIDGFTGDRVIIRDPWPIGSGSSYTVPIDKLKEVILKQAVTIKNN